ncbi:MAG: LCP family protein, partial [Oscillospiraceae bacterium]|nr:LCP family protein [Oscillospiraceae bacterium]
MPTTPSNQKPDNRKPAGSKAKAKKRKKTGRIIMTVLMLLLLIASAVFVYFVGKYALEWFRQFTAEEKDIPDFAITSHDTTPLKNRDKVAYYVVGLMGEDKDNDRLEMLSLLCVDKAAGRLSILQLPQDTWLGEEDRWAVNIVSDIWANPKEIDWCDTCRRRVRPNEIEDDMHIACKELDTSSTTGSSLPPTPISKRTGSATSDLIAVFNDQYAMPVDNYFIIEQPALVKLVNLCGGVDIRNDIKLETEDVVYEVPKEDEPANIIDGNAALQYVLTREEGIGGDIKRMERFQQVFTAILQQMALAQEEDLRTEVIQPLMNGSTPVRVEIDTEVKTIVEIAKEIARIPLEKATAFVIPGYPVKSGQDTWYSVAKVELLELLNSDFNPYNNPL